MNFRQSPNLVATAYTNSVDPAPIATELYAIDSTRNILTKIAKPNDSMVTTIGPLGVNIVDSAGFDIWGSGVTLESYAVLRVEDSTSTGLYNVNLTTGAATLIAPINNPSPILSFAVEP